MALMRRVQDQQSMDTEQGMWISLMASVFARRVLLCMWYVRRAGCWASKNHFPVLLKQTLGSAGCVLATVLLGSADGELPGEIIVTPEHGICPVAAEACAARGA